MKGLGKIYILFLCASVFGAILSLFISSSSLAQSSQFPLAQRVLENPAQTKSIPRFVSLKRDRVNVRRGPSTTHKVDFVFTRKGLPVEVIAEFDLWRRIRDSEGDEGWVYHTLLSGERTVLIAPWDKKKMIPLYKSAQSNNTAIAYAETGVLGHVSMCDGKRCLLVVNDDTKGWIAQTSVWGVYPNEVF